MTEVWKPIWGYTGKYEVSDKGRVRKTRHYKDGRIKKSIVPQFPNNRGGYMMVHLIKNGADKFCQVHRLVGKAFIPNTSKKPREIDHINRDVTDNRVKNLRWVTHKQNMQYMKMRKKNA